MSTVRHLLSIDDLAEAEVWSVLERASAFSNGKSTPAPRELYGERVVGTLFLSSSTRTRVGFEVAAQRLCARTVSITQMRYDDRMSGAESVADALRVVSGMVDVLVCRGPVVLAAEAAAGPALCPILNGGDRQEHPSQALIDLAAIQQWIGPHNEARVLILGDLTMRASRSLLGLFARFPPADLLLCAPPSRRDLGSMIPADRVTWIEPEDIKDVDVVIVTGLAPGVGHGAIPERERRRYSITLDLLTRLPSHALIHSPMPVIDEICPEGRSDPRNRMFEASDLAVGVRMALLELLLVES